MKGSGGSGPGLGPPGPGGPAFALRFLSVYISFYASNVYSTYIFRIGSSKVGLRQSKNDDFSDWVIQGRPAAARKSRFFDL